MDKKGYRITLSDDDRALLEKIIKENKFAKATVMRARILLACDERNRGQNVTLAKLAENLGVPRTNVQNVRADFKQGGMEYALYNKKEFSSDSLSQKRIATLMENVAKMMKEQPPEGKKRWTVRLISSECIRRGYAEHLSAAHVSKLLKKYGISTRGDLELNDD